MIWKGEFVGFNQTGFRIKQERRRRGREKSIKVEIMKFNENNN